MELHRDAFVAALRRQLGDDVEVALFWKGRVALWAILGALGVGPGDEVILPAFTCVVVPSAILYRGARPIYVDIDARTLTLDVAGVRAAIGPRTRVILAQNTFGQAPPLDELVALGRERGVAVVEDCAHGFGGRYRGRPNGTSGDAAFFSTQWNKPFSTGLGGIAVTRKRALARRIARIGAAAASPRLGERLALRGLAALRRHFLRPATYWAALNAYRFLGQHGVVPGSSARAELEETTQPARYVLGFSGEQARLGLDELARLPARLQHRRHIAGLYRTSLSSRLECDFAADEGHGHLRFPVLVRDRERLFDEARRRGLEVGDWFLSPLHPIVRGLERWGYRPGAQPVAERISARVITLPTHVDETQAERLVQLLSQVG